MLVMPSLSLSESRGHQAKQTVPQTGSSSSPGSFLANSRKQGKPTLDGNFNKVTLLSSMARLMPTDNGFEMPGQQTVMSRLPRPPPRCGKGQHRPTGDEALEPSASKKNSEVSLVKEGFYEGQIIPKEILRLSSHCRERQQSLFPLQPGLQP